jgi:peptidoglycan/xylan/chitin deacetylase (PgdA/CDA1 family)
LPLYAAFLFACGQGVPILMYHSVSGNGDPLTVRPDELDAQLDYLQNAGFSTVTLREVLDADDGKTSLPPHPVVLTFDDGYDDAATAVLPRLVARGQKATFFIVSGHCAADAAGRITQDRYRFMTWGEVLALRNAGMEIGSHSVSHRKLTALHEMEMRAEVQDSRAMLQKYLGQPVELFAYPYNSERRSVRLAVEKAGYRAAVMGSQGNTDRFTLQRLTMHRGITPQDLRSMLGETWATAYTGGG